MDEQNLSQKMSQLLAGTTNEKYCLMNDIKVKIDKIPDYLTKRNKSFKQMLDQALLTTTTTTTTTVTVDNNLEELRKITILIYKIMVIQTFQLLRAAHLKSGVGQLITPSKTNVSYSATFPIWSKDIKKILSTKNMDETNENENCLKLVNNHLHELEHQLKQCQIELNLKANSYNGYTCYMQKIIETYIEQNLRYFRMKIEHEIEIIHYDYHILAMKLEYFQHNPNTFQKQLMEELCQSKYERETTEQEVDFLKQQISYYNSSSQSFQCSPIAHDPLIDSIQNSDIRQQLSEQYKQIAEQSRANIFTLYMNTAEEQREEYKKNHDTNVKKMWDAYHSSSDNEKISPKMLDLMHQRCLKISDRIKCIYKFKVQSILTKS